MLNFFSSDVRRDPFPFYEQARAHMPVLHEPASKAWLLFRYADVKRALTDHEGFSSSMLKASRGNPEWLVFFDPPKHTKLRALVSTAFTPKSIANLEQRIRELARMLLGPLEGTVDIAQAFAVPLPILVIAELLGIPPEDWPLCRRWTDTTLKLSYSVSGGPEAQAATLEFRAMTAEMIPYLDVLSEARRREPQDDLLTRLVLAEVDGLRLTAHEILGFFQILLVAGNETTTNLINNAILCFLEHPDQLQRLRQNPELLPSAIEEVLRYKSPFQWTFRATAKDIQLGGETIPAGQLVLPVMGSANRDAAVFEHPNTFDITREPNPHVAFGHGIHFCLGAPLSRLEARVALTEFLAHVDDFTGQTDNWQPRSALHVYGPVSLPLDLKRAGTAGISRTWIEKTSATS